MVMLKKLVLSLTLTLVSFVFCRAALAADHIVLGVAEFQDLPDKQLSFETFRKLKEELGYLSQIESQYVSRSGCWEKAETSAAKQFAGRMKGMSEHEILSNVGAPLVRLQKLNYWNQGKEKDKVTDWLYFFGFKNTPVRLRMKNAVCEDSFDIKAEEDGNYLKYMMIEYARAEGMGEEQVIEEFGAPERIETQSPLSKSYIYPYTRGMWSEMQFEKGVCTRSSSIVRLGWRKRKTEEERGK